MWAVKTQVSNLIRSAWHPMKLLPPRIEALRPLRQRAATLVAFLIITAVLAWGHWYEGSLFWSWDLLGVPRMPPPNLPFTDTISVTHAIDCFRQGFDPYQTGRCDPWN